MTTQKTTAKTTGTPYDDVYRTLITDCPSLIIPVVNEVFHTELLNDETVTALENEVFLYRQNGELTERITDSNLLIASKRYHFECQSTTDNSMLIRIFEYDSQIALQDSKLHGHILTVNFPNTAILYLRHSSNTPDTMQIQINVPGGECHYEIPVMKVSLYAVEEIFSKKLYFLIPFHIFSYEHQLKEYDNNEEKLRELTRTYEDIIIRLYKCAKAGEISEYIKRTIIDMSKQVLKHISKRYSNVRKKVGEIMGGQVLEYEAKDILNKGIAEGRSLGHAEGHAEGITEQKLTVIRKKLAKNKTPEEIADALEESVEAIVNLIKEHHLM